MLLSEWKNQVIEELNITDQDLLDEMPELLGMKPIFLGFKTNKGMYISNKIDTLTGNPYVLYLTAYLACLKFDNDHLESKNENEKMENRGGDRKEYVSNILNHYCAMNWDNTYLEYASIISATEYSDKDRRGAFEDITNVIMESIEKSFQNNCYVHLSFSLWVRSILYRWYKYKGTSEKNKDCDKKSLAENIYSLFRNEKNDKKGQKLNKSEVKIVTSNTIQNWIAEQGIENDFSKNIAYIVQLSCLEFDFYYEDLVSKTGNAVHRDVIGRKRLDYAIEKVRQYGCRELYSRNIEHFLLREATRGVISFRDIEWHKYCKDSDEYIVNISKLLKYLVSLERIEEDNTNNLSFEEFVIGDIEKEYLDNVLGTILEDCEYNNRLDLSKEDINFINRIKTSENIEKRKYEKEQTLEAAAPVTAMMNDCAFEVVDSIQALVGYTIKNRENFYISNVFEKRLKLTLIDAYKEKNMKYPIDYENSNLRPMIRMVLPSYADSYKKLLNNSIPSRNWLLNLCLRLRTTRDVINNILEDAQYYGLSDDKNNIESYYNYDTVNNEFIGTVQWYQQIEKKAILERRNPELIPIRYPEYYALGTKQKMMILLIVYYYIDYCYSSFKEKILLEHLLDIVYRQYLNGALSLSLSDFLSESNRIILLKDGKNLYKMVKKKQDSVNNIKSKCGEKYYKDIYYEEFALFGDYSFNEKDNSQVLKENQDELTKLRLFASYMYLVITGRYYIGELTYNSYMWIDDGFKKNLNIKLKDNELKEMLEYFSNIMFLFLEDNVEFADNDNKSHTYGYYKNGISASGFNSEGMSYRTVRPDDDNRNYIGGPEYSWGEIYKRIYKMLSRT